MKVVNALVSTKAAEARITSSCNLRLRDVVSLVTAEPAILDRRTGGRYRLTTPRSSRRP
jgi:hypothetical protein